MKTYSEAELQRFRDVQQLAYRCVVAVEGELSEGMTERDVARRMKRWLTAHGVHEYFHVPFVWFGDRTSFCGFRTPLDFLPTRRRLEVGMPVILDVAPAIDGYAADIGYSCCLGPNEDLAQMQDALQAHRDLIPPLVEQGKTAKQIYAAIDELCIAQGYANRHQVYPFRVLAHEVFRLERSLLERVTLFGFGIPARRGLASRVRSAMAGLEHSWPFWSDARESDVPITAGLWAVEPHIGIGPVGAKWEELLVVEPDGRAYWLDDELPHVRRWRDRGLRPAA